MDYADYHIESFIDTEVARFKGRSGLEVCIVSEGTLAQYPYFASIIHARYNFVQRKGNLQLDRMKMLGALCCFS